MGVVDALEVVDVDEQERELGVVQARMIQRNRELFLQGRSVGQAGEGVEVRKLADPGVGLQSGGDVLLNAVIAQQSTLSVSLGGERDLVPERRPVGSVVEQRHVCLAPGGHCPAQHVDRSRVSVGALEQATAAAENLIGGIAGQRFKPGADIGEGKARLRCVRDDDAGDLDRFIAHGDLSSVGERIFSQRPRPGRMGRSPMPRPTSVASA